NEKHWYDNPFHGSVFEVALKPNITSSVGVPCFSQNCRYGSLVSVSFRVFTIFRVIVTCRPIDNMKFKLAMKNQIDIPSTKIKIQSSEQAEVSTSGLPILLSLNFSIPFLLPYVPI